MTEYTSDEIIEALYASTNESGIENWLTILIENKVTQLGVHPDSDHEFIDKLTDDMWPEAMTAVLTFIMMEQASDQWDVEYDCDEKGYQTFTIKSRFYIGQPKL